MDFEYYLDLYKAGFVNSIFYAIALLIISAYLWNKENKFYSWVVYFVSHIIFIVNFYLQDYDWLFTLSLTSLFILSECYWKILTFLYCKHIKQNHLWHNIYSGDKLLYRVCLRCNIVEWQCSNFPNKCLFKKENKIKKTHWSKCQCDKSHYPKLTE